MERQYTIVMHQGAQLRDVLEKMAAEVNEFVKAGWGASDVPVQIIRCGSTWHAVKELTKYIFEDEEPASQAGAED